MPTETTEDLITRVVTVGTADTARDGRPATQARRGLRRTPILQTHVLRIAAGLILLQLLVRTAVAARSDFYWDDLILVGRAGRLPLLSTELLLYDHDGHFMPAAFVAAGIATRIAPYEWAVPMLMMVTLQALASLAMLRLLRLLLGWRPALLAPLMFYLFTPLTLPAFTWWAAALNSLPMQIALAWVAADAILLCRTGRLRYAVTGVSVFVVSLLFFEKSVLVPFVAFAAVTLLLRVDGDPTPVRTALRRGARLWAAAAVVIGVWFTFYVTTVASQMEWAGLSRTVELFHRGTSMGLLPTLLGGPWTWDRWLPSPTWAAPSAMLVGAGWVFLATLIVGTLRWKQRIGWVWVSAAAYFLLSLTAMVAIRWGAGTIYELAQTLRYFTDTAVVLAIAAALILRAPPRAATRPVTLRATRPVTHARALGAFSVAVAFLASCLWSTYTYTLSWQISPTHTYLATARESLAARDDAPLLEQPASIWVLLPMVYPDNLISRIFTPLPHRPEFADSTTELRMMDDSGRIVDAEIAWVRAIEQGPIPDCGVLVEHPRPVLLPLDGPLTVWEWTVQLNYLANGDGEVEVSIGGDAVTVPVRRGPNNAFVRLSGGGDGVRIASRTPGLSICVGMGPVGYVVPSR